MPKDCTSCNYYKTCSSYFGGPQCAYKKEIVEHMRKESKLADEKMETL